MQNCTARPFALRVRELEERQANLEGMLVEKQAEMDRLLREMDELRHRPTTVHYNNNSVNVNIMAYGTEPLPDTLEVRGILIPPETSVAKYIALKHFRDPSTSNLRISNKKSKTIQVVEPDINNDLRWTERNRKQMIEKLVDDNLEELTDAHGASKVERWRRWYKSSGLEEEGYDKTDAYRRIEEDVENMLLSQKNTIL
jgi:hypothetical protein